MHYYLNNTYYLVEKNWDFDFFLQFYCSNLFQELSKFSIEIHLVHQSDQNLFAII